VAPASPAPGVLATPPRTPGAATAGAAPRTLIVVDREPDALTFASDFVHALLKPDYEGARRLVDQAKVPPVKLAALCIVFEEGTYRLADEKPLMSTVATESTSWVIARVRSAALDQQTEFGLEMERAGNEWRVGGLNLSKFLSDNARDSAIDGIPYTPLVHNPRGGEAIALFYEFDRADLHPRAQKQLDIIVQMLRNSPQKKLRISGFTDARGSDAYNLNLSRSRAEAVKKYILSRGVPLAQVETTGFGKALPISPNVRADGSDNPEGRSRNRRAEILLDF
jgi:outer membrane protein OmpA-like peptidoglycan-associated protein